MRAVGTLIYVITSVQNKNTQHTLTDYNMNVLREIALIYALCLIKVAGCKRIEASFGGVCV